MNRTRHEPTIQIEYETLRRHGLGHEAALAAVDDGEPFVCWCGSETPCEGGAQRFVGCPVNIGFGSPHIRHRGDLR